MAHKYYNIFLSLTIAFLLLSSACTSQETKETKNQINLAARETLPAEVRNAAYSVSEAYRFAAANPEILTQIPCYCGCGSMDHTSNYDCYILQINSVGLITYDLHALGCSICVDITQDTMRLLEQGKSLSEIRAYIDSTYSQFGPSNLP